MARQPECWLTFADGKGDGENGEYLFRLNLRQIEELQDKCAAGPPEIQHRLLTNTWKVEDVRETIRLGLIGGGMEARPALTLVKRYVDDCAYTPNVLIAIAVMQARLYPFEDSPLGELEAAETETPASTTTTDDSTSPPSTASAPASDTAQSK